jgi:hypothetical protein
MCLLFCYYFKVLKGLRGVVLAAVKSNFYASLRPDFVDRMVAELRSMEAGVNGIRYVRVHDGGDLYSQSYIQKWVEIALRLPELIFFIYTKSLHFDLAPLERLPNFVVIKSFSGLDDDKIAASDNYAVVAADVNQAVAQAALVGGEVCPPELLGLKLTGPNRSVWCGVKCRYCMEKGRQIKVFFIQQNDGWNGPPPDAIERIKALDRHGLLKPENAVQQRRLDNFRRKYGRASP